MEKFILRQFNKIAEELSRTDFEIYSQLYDLVALLTKFLAYVDNETAMTQIEKFEKNITFITDKYDERENKKSLPKISKKRALGAVLEEKIEEMGLTIEGFAKLAGLPLNFIDELIFYDAPIDEQIAKILEETTLIPYYVWLKLKSLDENK